MKNGNSESSRKTPGRKTNLHADSKSVPENLRLKAKEILRKEPMRLKEISGQDLQQIIHELGTHQIELEIQNEDLRITQAELEKSRKRYIDLYDFSPVGYFTVDPKGNIVSVNLTGASMLEKARNRLIGQKFQLFVHEEDRDIYHLHFRKLTREEGSQKDELRMLKKRETPFHVLLESITIKDDTGSVVEVRTVVTDITDKKEKELKIRNLNTELKNSLKLQETISDQLLRSNKDLLHFAFIASHDLQEPMRTISNFVQLLERRYKETFDDKGRLFMKYIIEATGHMQRQLKDLLTYSRVGNEELTWQPVSLESVVDRIKKNLAMIIEETGAEITYSVLPVVQGDEDNFSTLLQNLIGNSLKYHGKNTPRIHISARHNQNQWVVCVQDNGIGIDPVYADQIFLIFKRLHNQDEYEGTGIGLAICKQIVERHGGRIWVDSTPGGGASFCFSLPT